MDELENNAYKYAIKNAFLHKGKADPKAVLGKIKALHHEISLKEAGDASKKAIEKVNRLEFEEIKKEYNRYEQSTGFELKPVEKTQGLPKLSWAKRHKVITRFAPNPNGLMHIGSARAAVLSSEYAKKYKGKFILRFDDTDPKIKIPIDDAEEQFKKDLKWLGCNINETYFASDRLHIYKEYMQKLVDMGRAYVCTCKAEDWREKIKKQVTCPCREKSRKEHSKRLEKMQKNNYKEGKAVLRIKTILSHRDPSVRDWWIAKVVEKPRHPRVKTNEHLWPSYNFASAIDDHLLGVTLIIRGQEHQQNETKQLFLYNYFGWEYPHAIYTGRVMLEGVTLSTSKIREGIEKGQYSGWDDPKLGTIAALRRRGFTADSIKKIILDIGTKPNDTTIEWNTLTASNRDIISKKSPKINTLETTSRLIVEYGPEKEVKFNSKCLKINSGLQDFHIEKKFVREGFCLRLRDAYNVKVKKVRSLQAFSEYAGEEKKEPIIQWLLEPIKIIIAMPDRNIVERFADKKLNFKKNETYYIENLGFIRIDKVSEESIEARFAHR